MFLKSILIYIPRSDWIMFFLSAIETLYDLTA